MSAINTRFCFWILFLFFIGVKAQNFSFPEQEIFKWKTKSVIIPDIPENYKDADAVILEEDIDVNYATVSRRVLVKIQNDEGALHYQSLNLPENFDLTSHPNLFKQGRFKNRTIPYVYNFQILFFKARLFDETGKELPLESDVSGEKTYWVNSHGERIYDHYRKFSFLNLKAGHILEFTYKAMHEDSRLIYYLNGVHPKLKLNVNLIPYFAYYNFNKEDSLIFSGVSEYSKAADIKNRRFIYTFKNLDGVSYPAHAQAASNFKHFYFGSPSLPWARFIVDWKTASVPLRNIFNNVSSTVFLREGFGIPYFFLADTTDNIPVYLKSNLALKKYSNLFERETSDSSCNQWMSKVCEDISTHKFLSAENLHYANNNQYALSSSERLLKKELVEEFMLDVYENLFMEKKMYYYTISLSDKRLHQTNISRYDHYFYQRIIFAVPEKKGLIFYVPRYNGVKYFANELPFYFEGQTCSLFPSNISVLKKRNDGLKIGFTTTPFAKSSDNVRTESAVFKILTDSLLLKATIKESLSGQFSTILRHYYSGDAIDSTINPRYFKMFTDKPGARNIKVSLVNSSNAFPFKHTYSGSFSTQLKNKGALQLKDYFSFTFNKDEFQKKVNHDFYPDFMFSDSYNFLFEFDRPVILSNKESFIKNYSNSFFEIFSDLIKQDESHYLLTVKVKVKKELVPKLHSGTVNEFVNILSELNNMTLEYQ